MTRQDPGYLINHPELLDAEHEQEVAASRFIAWGSNHPDEWLCPDLGLFPVGNLRTLAGLLNKAADTGQSFHELVARDKASVGELVKVLDAAHAPLLKSGEVLLQALREAEWRTRVRMASVAGNEQALAELFEEKKTLSAESTLSKLVPVTTAELFSIELPERSFVLSPVLPDQGLVLLYGPRGIAKTWIALLSAYAVAATLKILGRWDADQARRVLYLDGEMPAVAIRDRLASIVAGCDGEPPSPDYLKIITPDLQPGPMPNLASGKGQAALEPFLEGVDLVVVDNLATLARYGRENDSESWTPLQTWCLSQRRKGRSVLLVHHAGKAGNQRGTSAREDVLDTVISLRRPADYQAKEGARFEIHLEKARGIFGDEAKPFEVTLRTEQGAAHWLTREIEDAELERVRPLHEDGQSLRDIAEETGLSRSKVHRLVKKLRGGGI